MVDLPRRSLLAGIAALGASACSRINDHETTRSLFKAAEDAHRAVHRALAGKQGLAREYARDARSPTFRGNGSVTIPDPYYQQQLAIGFPDWRLAVTGLVEQPLALSLADIRALPQRTQITRHDCVEGWSAIGKWQGAQLGPLLQTAGLKPNARFAVMHCADNYGGGADMYYESIDLIDGFHPQTILAYNLNGQPLDVAHGAPLRLRVERQLGYKHAKYLMRIEMVERLDSFGRGKGGYWEDRGYEWYAGI